MFWCILKTSSLFYVPPPRCKLAIIIAMRTSCHVSFGQVTHTRRPQSAKISRCTQDQDQTFLFSNCIFNFIPNPKEALNSSFSKRATSAPPSKLVIIITWRTLGTVTQNHNTKSVYYILKLPTLFIQLTNTNQAQRQKKKASWRHLKNLHDPFTFLIIDNINGEKIPLGIS